MESRIIKLEKLFFMPDPGKLCRMPYPGHSKGCPNWNKSPLCLPHVPKLQDKYDLSNPCYFVVQPFNIGAHKVKMKAFHPEWNDKQCGCCLYWQNGVRTNLKIISHNLCVELGFLNYEYELIPEAMGLNVFSTARYHGIKLVKNPQDILYKIAFVGVLKT